MPATCSRFDKQGDSSGYSPQTTVASVPRQSSDDDSWNAFACTHIKPSATGTKRRPRECCLLKTTTLGLIGELLSIATAVSQSKASLFSTDTLLSRCSVSVH